MECAFQGYLKQATAAQVVLVGPYVDDTDGKTPETGLTIANTDLKLSKNGAASADKNSGGGTHIEQGMYAITFDATDTSAVGKLFLVSLVSGARLVTHVWHVVEESVFDRMFAASAVGPMTAAEVNAEVVDALATDTYAEPGQGAPAATATLAAKINYLYKAWRNRKTQDSATFKLYGDDGATVHQKSTVTESGGVTSFGEKVTGP